MNQDNQGRIDLNHADLKTLTSLPGVGEGMAGRIIAGRPYDELEQLLAIQGVGVRTLERIRPYTTFGKKDEQTVKRAGLKATLEEAAGEAIPSFLERLEQFSERVMQRFQVPSQVVWFVLIAGAISVVLSVILSLTFLAGINRTLNFGRHATVRQIRSDISLMETTLNGLESDLASLDQRLQAVEGLSGRMATVEADFDLIKEDVGEAITVVDQLSQEVSGISEQVSGMADKVNLIDGFLEGLRALLSDLFIPAETAPAP